MGDHFCKLQNIFITEHYTDAKIQKCIYVDMFKTYFFVGKASLKTLHLSKHVKSYAHIPLGHVCTENVWKDWLQNEAVVSRGERIIAGASPFCFSTFSTAIKQFFKITTVTNVEENT